MNAEQELLDTAKDYFHFVTRFFEVIKVSAPHIYHSALELSPEQSIVRKNYYCSPSQGFVPKVVFGLSSSWEQPVAINGQRGSCAWSPCGQFFVTHTPTSVGVWDALTLEKLSSLQLTDFWTIDPSGLMMELSSMLSYSSDGCLLAGCSGSMITIWDVQTGGVVKEVGDKDCWDIPKSLVWSSDGTALSVMFGRNKTWRVYTYDVASGEIVSTNKFLSSTEPCLWQHNNTLQVMTILGDSGFQATISIFEVLPISMNHLIRSFSIKLNLSDESLTTTISFSPSTYRIAALTHKKYGHSGGDDILLAFDIQKSKILLQERNCSAPINLSPDGSLLATFGLGSLYVLKFTSEEGYVFWREFPCWNSSDAEIPYSYQFSPDSSSILIDKGDALEVRHLESPQTTLEREHGYYDVYSADGAYVVTASSGGRAIKFTNLRKSTSQTIYTMSSVGGLTLTSNILLVYGNKEVTGWQLTKEGYMSSLWIKSVEGIGKIFIEGHIGIIELSKENLFYYDTETGEELKPTSPPPLCFEGFLYGPKDYSGGKGLPDHCEFDCDKSPKDELLVSVPWCMEGWVKYPEGEHQHRFWLPVHWRPNEFGSLWDSSGYDARWLHKVMTLRIRTGSGLVIIKF